MSKRPEYIFNKEIESKLKNFENYLQEQGNKKETIWQKTNYTGYYLNWLENEHLQPENARYNDLLNFINYCHLEGKSKQHINNKLRSIRNFYEYLKTNDPDIANPALNLHLKGIKQKLPSNIISFENLEHLLNNYPTTTNRYKRNKAVLGLLIYQGVTTEELH